MRILVLASILALAACGSGGASDDAGDDGPDVESCEMDTDCASELCLEGPGVCTVACEDLYDCPLSSSWDCEPILGVSQCTCPGLTATLGCDPECDGVDEDATGTWFQSVASMIIVPNTLEERDQYALDIDGDGGADNALGSLVPLFEAVVTGSSVPSNALEAINQAAIEQGHLLYLHSFHGDATTSDPCASWRVHLAAQALAPPEFTGSDTFELDPMVDPGGNLFGSLDDGIFAGVHGDAPFRLRMGESSNAWVDFRLRGAKVVSEVAADGCATVRLGGGAPFEEAEPQLTNALTAEINRVIALDPQGAEAEQLRATFDANGDNIITVDEVRAVAGFGPDLDLVGADGNPGRDGVDDSLSVALAFGCVGATYPAPGE